METTIAPVNAKNPDFKNIPGWGIDADPKNDPTYPMKDRTDAEQTGYSWERPAQQPVNIEVLHSNERPNVSAVFGTASPPSGLSGQIRRYAFQYSESKFRHWLPLIVADRVNVVEGIVEDIRNGKIPNFFAEKGYKAMWKHNPKGLATNIAITVGVATLAYLWLSGGRNRSRD
ncbi:hypothetical protein [Tellurirhabdus rosea]|uniref:hypothetical protein n=1 Tax=Tellurirhabdus rosea TaxID=2674997 RepID=UPI0022579FB9|nr:hypothetical protein [Tellurirhabdus rosea]